MFSYLYLEENKLNKNNIVIRHEEKKNYREVESLVRDSFWNVYRPGCLEHYVLHVMRESSGFIPSLDYIMYYNDVLIGQIVYYKAKLDLFDGSSLDILTMGPIAIKNEYKRQGFGKYLLDYTLDKATSLGWGGICFEGNFKFYSTCGFTYARDYGIKYHGLKEGDDDSFFFAKELKKDYFKVINGVYSTPEVYFVSEADAESFDKTFPFKVKEKLPSQIF